MNASQLKAMHLTLQPDSHFFTRDTMRFFGDTMRNFKVRKACTNTYILSRRQPVKNGLNSTYEFNIISGVLKTIQ